MLQGQTQPQQQQQQQQNGQHSQGQQRTPSKPSRRRSLSSFLPRANLQKDVESQQIVDASSDTAEASLTFLPIPGPMALLGVAFLWGTYGPALRLLYSLPGPPDPAAFTAARGLIQVQAPLQAHDLPYPDHDHPKSWAHNSLLSELRMLLECMYTGLPTTSIPVPPK